jgi:substrate import-associated zinc metallohydrolase lipoprotein
MKIMKKILITTLIISFFTLGFTACESDDDPDTSKSVIVDSQREENDFDRWITENYVKPYNITVKYRMEDIESNMNYYLVPAEYKKAIQICKLAKFLCLEAYDEVTGSKDFIRSNYPKLIHLVGSAAYKNNGNIVLGTAEGGLKITLYYVNSIQMNTTWLNHYYFKTMHHEFTHILNQTKPFTTDFNAITPTGYVADSWSDVYSSEDKSLPDGFISPYSSSEPNEDFAELVSLYVTTSADGWAEKLSKAGTSGASLLNAKFDIVYQYMMDNWDIDLNVLRDVVQKRQGEISSLDLDNL